MCSYILFFIIGSILNTQINGNNITNSSTTISQNTTEEVQIIGDVTSRKNLNGTDAVRSLLSLVNIQLDLWESSFTNGFSSITFEDERSGFLHNLNEDSTIEIGNEKYMIISRNKPKYDSLIIYYEDIYEDSNTITNNTKRSENLFVVLNETENELIIKSDKISKGSVCMGLLNGTEIWSPEFCEITRNVEANSDSKNITNFGVQVNSDLYCICYGAFIYTVSEPQNNSRLLQSQSNIFSFPDMNDDNTNVKIEHVNDSFMKKVTRDDKRGGNSVVDIPFPPLHSNLGGRMINKEKKINDNNKNNEMIKYAGIGDIMVDQDDLYKYYEATNSVQKYNKYRGGGSSKEYDNNKITEIDSQGKLNMEIEKARIKNSINKSSDPLVNFIKSNTNTNDNLKLNVEDIKNKMGDVKIITPIVDSISISMEINNFYENTIFNSKLNKEKFIYNFISILSRALSINPGRVKVTQLVSGGESNLLRGVVHSLIKLTVNIKTNNSDDLIKLIKNMPTKMNEFNKVFSYKILSIEKNSGLKSISNEAISNVNNQILKLSDTNNENVSNLLPIIFRMELKTKKAFINQRDAFDLFEDELARSMNISKNQIDIPEFNYKQVNDSLTNETFLIINTEAWIHPSQPSRDEYVNLLSDIYSNIIHSKTSSFSSLFICIKYEIKQIPRIRNQRKHTENNQNSLEIKNKSLTDMNNNLIEEGRISKIGKYFKYDSDIPKNKDSSGVNQETKNRSNKNRINLNDDNYLKIKPVVYLFQ
ncbi:hypothetical protein RS030_81485 [Cryptosporidium xiaoi]|uniref:Uncharacterized protein n=1 Tax=Cryptosporidium xiaoi TaxID=659607 RepID=A0AAV9XSR0_9CRYT